MIYDVGRESLYYLRGLRDEISVFVFGLEEGRILIIYLVILWGLDVLELRF